MTRRRRLLLLVAATLVVVLGAGAATIVVRDAAADERAAEIAATMRSDPAWDVEVPGARVVETDHVEGCGGRRDRGSRTSTQDYVVDRPEAEVVAAFAERFEAVGWRPAELPDRWYRVIDGRRYGLLLGHALDGRATLEMSSPDDMCPTRWL